jgi:glycosyltransferase involved in cell wall biosynthesis
LYGLEIVVVDNASTDGTRECLERPFDDRGGFTMVANEENLGVGAGRNSGRERTTRDFVVILDEDTRITSDQLEFPPPGRQLRSVGA